MSQYKVVVQPSGREFTAGAEESVLSAALAAGITLPHGCKNGACGSCRGRLLSGRVEHASHAAGALSPEDEASGHALFCSAYARSDLVIESRIATGLDGVAPRRMPARIEHIERAAPDVAILTLRLPANESMQFRPGQYIDFILPGGLRRSYSIASPMRAGEPLEFHIRHLPGGVFTDALFGLATAPSVKERGILRIEGPLGTFYLREDETAPIVLLASGTGFAPIKAIAEQIFAAGLHRDDPASGRRARPVVLYWGARGRVDLYLDAVPRRWEQEEPNFRYVPVLSEPKPEDAWQGRTGFVHRAVMEDLPDLSAHHVYACGVPVMVQSAQHDFVSHCRLQEENFFCDAFVSSADIARAHAAVPTAPAAPPAS
jgi:CDP-4-dehydro-6-deoxyglucose reductase